jgi:hypothetical protein
MDLTALEMVLGSGAIATVGAMIPVTVKLLAGKKNGNGNGKHACVSPEMCAQRHEAHAQIHKEESRLSEERFTNVYKKVDGMKEMVDQRLGRIENLLDRRLDSVGDPTRGRREAD